MSTRNEQTASRRAELLTWITDRSQHSGLTSQEIVDVSGVYDKLQGRQEKCTQDCRYWLNQGKLSNDGRKINPRWYA